MTKTTPLSHSIAVPTEAQVMTVVTPLKEMGEIANRFLEQFRADLAPLAKIQPFVWQSWQSSTTAQRRSRQDDDMPEWLLSEIAHGSF